tara:strand:- start:935 stop:3268 length:2334 start_codon:yes stop_codon:yes gene_type:complete
MKRKYNSGGMMDKLEQYPYINTSYKMPPSGQSQDKQSSDQDVADYNLTVGKKYPKGGYMQVPQQPIPQPQMTQQPIPQEGNYGVEQELMTAESGGYMNRMQSYEAGGQNLPGGNMQPIPGSDAVQFNGQSHDQGGIMVDSQTEVEGGETMDKVTMAEKGGRKQDYFFSDHLKKGGMSYASQHKQILANGGDQKQIDMLAKMQEHDAGRNPEDVQVAETGGKYKYAEGGKQHGDKNTVIVGDDQAKSIMKDEFGVYPKVNGKEMTDRQKKAHDKFISKGLVFDEKKGSYSRPEDYVHKTKEEVEAIKKEASDNKSTSASSSSSSSSKSSTASRNNKFKVASDVHYGDTEGTYGDIPDHQPGYKVGDMQLYAGKDDKAFKASLAEEDFRGNWMTNADPEVLEAAGITSFADMNDEANVTKYQEAWNVSHADNPVVVDGKFGEQTWRTATGPSTPEEVTTTDEETTVEETTVEDTTELETLEKKKDWITPLVGAAQLLPAIYAFNDKPDYMSDHPMASPGAIIPERIAKTHLERIDMNPEKARNASDFANLNRFIDTAGGGPSGMMNKMASYAKKQQGDRDISAQESRANVAIANQEAVMDQERKTKNVNNSLQAQTVNVGTQTDVNKFNATMEGKVDEFNRGADAATTDRRLNALDSVVTKVAGMNADRLAYASQERMAEAISGQTGVYDREIYSQALLSNDYVKGTDSYNNMMNQYSKNKMNSEVADNEKKLASTNTSSSSSSTTKTTTTKKYDAQGKLITTVKKGGFIPSGYRRRYS